MNFPDFRRSTLTTFLPAALLVGLLTAFAIWGARLAPFHPDESTQLYMSSDFERLFRDPTSMAWDPNQEHSLRQHYRELDAPLTKYLLGLARTLVGLPSLPSDWDWSKSWEENRQAGALPTPDLLQTGRIAITLLLPFSLAFIYLSGKKMSDAITGALAALLLGLNALMLLHGRRAMAEGALVFGITFFIWSLFQADRRPWLAGLAMALAFNAKQSALALLPAGLAAVAWFPTRVEGIRWKVISGILQFALVFILVTMLLNPLYWRQPLHALRASLAARQELVYRQVSDRQDNNPNPSLEAPNARLVALLANLYFTPPAFAEVSNYTQNTWEAEATYLAIPGHNLLRGFIGGGLLLTLTLFGLVLSLTRQKRAAEEQRRSLVLLLLATLCQAIFLLVSLPLPWQRYMIPLVPFACLWAAYGLGVMFDPLLKKRS